MSYFSQDSGWEDLDDPQSTELFACWWGCGEENVGGPGTIINIPQEELWPFLGDLQFSEGKIFVRAEYPEM